MGVPVRKAHVYNNWGGYVTNEDVRGLAIDVTGEEPFALMHCPTCGAAMRVRRQFNHFELQELLVGRGLGEEAQREMRTGPAPGRGRVDAPLHRRSRDERDF